MWKTCVSESWDFSIVGHENVNEKVNTSGDPCANITVRHVFKMSLFLLLCCETVLNAVSHRQ